MGVYSPWRLELQQALPLCSGLLALLQLLLLFSLKFGLVVVNIRLHHQLLLSTLLHSRSWLLVCIVLKFLSLPYPQLLAKVTICQCLNRKKGQGRKHKDPGHVL